MSTSPEPPTVDDIRQLLVVAMGYDNRNPGELSAAAWTEAARRGRWTFQEALEAIHSHYAERTEWIMPGHITERIRATRQDQAMRETAPQLLPAERKERALATTRALEGLAARNHSGPRAVGCPFCGAPAGQPCTRPGLKGPRKLGGGRVHDARRAAAPAKPTDTVDVEAARAFVADLIGSA